MQTRPPYLSIPSVPGAARLGADSAGGIKNGGGAFGAQPVRGKGVPLMMIGEVQVPLRSAWHKPLNTKCFPSLQPPDLAATRLSLHNAKLERELLVYR
jgi:hypothetical protein